MRERTTWNRERVAANLKKVAEDPRAMNQDHLQQQPGADDYVIGGPSEFAEDVHPEAGTWKAEYGADGETARNEIGMPEMRGDTFKSAGLDVTAVNKKAELATKVARVMLKGASEQAIEDQAFTLMDLPEAHLTDTYNRLAAQQGDDDGDDGDEGQDKEAAKKSQEQEQQAQEQQDKEGQGQQEGQDKEAAKKSQEQEQQVQGQDEEGQDKEAAKKSQEQEQQAQGQDEEGQDKDEGDDQEGQAKEAAAAALKAAGLDPMAQQQLMSQVQQMVQQAMQQQMQQAQQQQAPMQQAPMQQQSQQQMQQQGMGALSEEELMDQMLQDQESQILAESDIQMDTPNMDVGDVVLSQQDQDVLGQIFASNAEVQNAMTAQAIENGGTPVQASQQPAPQGTVRTAATRTVGTRPTAGVSQLGGGTAPEGGGDEVSKLSSMWSSAPDVSGAFS